MFQWIECSGAEVSCQGTEEALLPLGPRPRLSNRRVSGSQPHHCPEPPRIMALVLQSAPPRQTLPRLTWGLHKEKSNTIHPLATRTILITFLPFSFGFTLLHNRITCSQPGPGPSRACVTDETKVISPGFQSCFCLPNLQSPG